MQPYLQYDERVFVDFGDDKFSHFQVLDRINCVQMTMGRVAMAPVFMFNPSPSLQESSHRSTLTFLHCAQQCCVSPPINKDKII